MSSDAPDTPRFVPVLKPYAGVGQGFFARHYQAFIAAGFCLAAIPYGFYYALTTPWLLVAFLTPIAVLMLLVIWVFPDSGWVPEKTIQTMTLASFATLSLWPSYLAIDLPGLPWITFIRLVTTPLTLIVLVAISSSADFRRRFAEVLNDAPLVWKFLVAFVVCQILSLPFSHHIGDSMSKFVVFQTNQTLLLLLAGYVFSRPGRTERLGAMCWAFCVIVSVMALIEQHEQKLLWVDHMPSFLSVDETVQKILAGSTRANTGEYRAQAVFSTPLGFSEFLSFGLPLVLHFASSGRYAAWQRTLAWLSIPLILQAILASDSRLGILGFFLSTMLYLFVWAVRAWRKDKRGLVPITVLAAYPVLMVMVIISTFTVGRIKTKVWGMGQYDDSNAARGEQVRQGIPHLISHPLGNGPGMAAETLGFTNPGGTITIDVGLLATALDYGVLGFIFHYGIFIACIVYAMRHVMFKESRNHEFTFAFPLCLSIVNFIAIKGVLAQEENHPIIFMMAGVVVGLVHQARKGERQASAAALALAQSGGGSRQPRPAPSPRSARPLAARSASPLSPGART